MKIKIIYSPLITIVLVYVFSVSALAHPSYKKQFMKTYPGADKRLYVCDQCHSMEGFELNPYGKDFLNNDFDFKKIENIDSDGDGYTNIEEINYPRWAGDKTSVPKEHVNPATFQATIKKKAIVVAPLPSGNTTDE